MGMNKTPALPWLITGLSVATSISYAVVLSLGPPDSAEAVLDFSGKVLGPVGAALIAWAGVAHTVKSSRRQDASKEWHQDVRWATELCFSRKPLETAVGVAVLTEHDDHSYLDKEQVKMVNRILDVVLEPIFEVDDREGSNS